MTPELSPLKSLLFLLIVFVFFVTVQSIVAQPVLYFPSEENIENKYFREKVVESQKKEKARISGFTKKQVNLINEQIDYRIDLLLSLMTSGEILFDSPLQKYVEAVFYKLLKANPVIDQNYQVIVSRSSVPNAFNVGGGFIIINTGLIERLQSEEELAFILAHELSHQVMDHVNQNIAENVIAETDKVRKEQIKKILQSRYRVYSQLENLILPGLTNEMSFRRSLELQADSLGLVYYLNSAYSNLGPLHTMLLLDRIDIDEDTTLIDYRSFFKSDSILFNPRWLKYGTASSLSGVIAPIDTLSDVLRTHPDALYRFDVLKNILQMPGIDTTAGPPPNPEFDQIRLLARIETIHGLFLGGSYSRAIHAALKTSALHPELEYPKFITSIMLSRLNKLRIEKKAGLYLDTTNKNYSETYNRTISFLWEINSKDCAQIAYWLVRPANPGNNRFQMEALLYSAMVVDRKKRISFTIFFIQKKFS
jgi:hypothetical protein